MKIYISLSTRINVPSVIMYHGTSSVFRKSILKKGLVPSKQKVWDSDKDAGFNRLPRTSLPGIYMTRNLMTAISSSSNATRKFGGDSILVVMNVQPKSLIVDEDQVLGAVQRMLSNSIAKVLGVSTSSDSAWICLRIGKMLKTDIWNKVIEEFVELVKVAYNIKNTKAIKQFVYSLVDYNYAHATKAMSKWDKQYGIKRWYYTRNGKKLVPPEVSRLEIEVGSAEKALTRAMAVITEVIGDRVYKQKLRENRDDLYSDVNQYSGRMKEGIQFRGKNRILAIVLEEDRRNLSRGEPTKLELVYGDSLPDDFLKQYSNRVGKNYIVSKGNQIIHDETRGMS